MLDQILQKLGLRSIDDLKTRRTGDVDAMDLDPLKRGCDD